LLDLRNDPGGLLDAAIAVSAAFLPTGTVVVSTKGQIPESNAVFKARPEDYLQGWGADPLKNLPAALKTVPMVVLVNQGSASASEIVSGALQDHRRATVMGAQTFGKGSVQTVRPLGPDTGMKLTTARYYTPSGRSIQAKGIVPDIMVDDTAEGSPYASLYTRESDLEHHLQGTESDKKDSAALEKEREAAINRLEAEAKKPESQRRPPEYGSDKDFPLQQAIAKLQGKPVQASKTLTERKVLPKDSDE
jgi:carboxyl-terminal processing protease